MRSGLANSLLLIAAAVFTLPVTNAEGQSVQDTRGQVPSSAAFTLNVRTYGWEPSDRRRVSVPLLAVDHEGRLLLAFTVRERSALVTRESPSLDLRILRFSRKGDIDLSLSVPTHEASRSGIYLSDADRIVARANDKLQLLTVDHDSSQIEWTLIAPCGMQCNVVQSQTRRTMLVYTEAADPMTLIRFSGMPASKGCGKVVASGEDTIQNYPESISDRYAYSHSAEPETGVFAYQWPLCHYENRVEMPVRIGGRWIVLTDELFAVNSFSNRAHRWDFEVVSADGQVKFRPTILKHESVGTLMTPVRSNEDGSRIAVDILTLRGGSRALDMASHVTARRIAVYDVDERKELASIPVNPRHRYGLAFDLSPDGHRLVILEDEKLTVIDID
jgi:hypothetical protein